MLAASGLAAVAGPAVRAQTKSLRLVAPFPPGGSTDILARALADKLAPALGQAVVVDNRPGANGAIGTEVVAKSPPDGQTLLLTTSAGIVINPLLYKQMANPLQSLVPIAQLVELELVLAVRADFPAKTLREFIEHARRHPNGLTFASVGPGSLSHLAGESFSLSTGAPLVHVPYKGAAPALTDLLGGQVDAYFGTPPTFVPHVKSGRIRVLATTAAVPSAAFPGLPRVADTVAGFEVAGWQGLFAPTGTPKEVLQRLEAATLQALADDSVKARLVEQGMRVTARPATELAVILRSERAAWTRLVEKARITVE